MEELKLGTVFLREGSNSRENTRTGIIEGCEPSQTHCPPKSCIPSRAKTTMNRKSRKSKLMMDFMEFSRETTRFLREFQYLRWVRGTGDNVSGAVK